MNQFRRKVIGGGVGFQHFAERVGLVSACDQKHDACRVVKHRESQSDAVGLKFVDPVGNDQPATLLTPVWVTKANMDATVLKDGYVDRAALCGFVGAAICQANNIPAG